MRSVHDEVLNLRLPAALRGDLDTAARAAGVKLSVVTRNALAVGLAAIRSNDDNDRPPPAAPSGTAMPAAA